MFFIVGSQISRLCRCRRRMNSQIITRPLSQPSQGQGCPVPCRAKIWWIRAVPNISVPCPEDPCRAKYFRAVPCLAVPGSWYQILVPGSWYQDLGTKILVPRSWYQDPGTKIWYQDPGTARHGTARKYLARHGSSGHGTEIFGTARIHQILARHGTGHPCPWEGWERGRVMI